MKGDKAYRCRIIAVTVCRADLLVRHIEPLREAVKCTRADRPFHIDAWVVIPDHMHCVTAPPPGDDDFSNRIKAMKFRFAQALSPTEGRSSIRMATGESQGQGRVHERQRKRGTGRRTAALRSRAGPEGLPASRAEDASWARTSAGEQPAGSEAGPEAALPGALRMQRGIWQRRFWEHAIRDEGDYARHTDYVHWSEETEIARCVHLAALLNAAARG